MAPRKLSELDDEELQAELDRRKPTKKKAPAKKVAAKKRGNGIVRIFEMDEETYSRTHGGGSGKVDKSEDEEDEIDEEEEGEEDDDEDDDEEPEGDKKGSRYFGR